MSSGWNLLVILGLASLQAVLAQSNLVQIRNGLISGGQAETVDNHKSYYYFRGIPYAEPPVGELRFEQSVPKNNWQGVLNATQDGEICIQKLDSVVIGSEDCLTINVYTPENPQDCSRLRPVLVWIYGGAFQVGNSTYDNFGPDHLLDQNIVVVSFNYRLGLLGFLTTGDSAAPGNNGLKDQWLALKWVRENIEHFCGDPNQVTLAGQSAGSVSVSYHLQSPLSRGLFHRVIMESGTSLSLWGLSRKIPAVVQRIAEALGVDNSSSRAVVDGLKTFNVTYLSEISGPILMDAFLSENPKDGLIIGPVIEPEGPDAFFSRKSHEGLIDGQFIKVPIMLGYNSLEGIFDFEGLFRLFLITFDLNNLKLIPIDLNIDPTRANEAARKIKQGYFGLVPISLSTLNLMKFLSDDQFVRGTQEFVRLTREHVPVYLYRFSYEGGLWGIYERNQTGVTHSEELAYYWRHRYEPIRDHDLVVKSRMVKLWSNFIIHGNPTPIRDTLLQNVIWTIADAQYNHLDIGEDLVMGSEPEKEKMAFWDGIYKEYGRPPYDTY